MRLDARELAHEFVEAYANGAPIASPPTTRDPGFDIPAAYAVEAEVVRLRRASGHAQVGRKVGFANKAMWRILKLDTLVWAHMYDDTVHHAPNGHAQWSIAQRYAPKIEPELVFKLKRDIGPGTTDPAIALEAVDWMALGFEINDCLFPDWQFKPADFVAALGFHTALVVGEPVSITADAVTSLVEALSRFTLTLSRHGEVVDEGSGRNSLRSPALCLCELVTAIAGQHGQDVLAGGELVSTGTLTGPQAIATGDEWTAEARGLPLPPLRLRL